LAAKPSHPDDSWPLFCAKCAAELLPGRGNFYLVRIDAVADPTPPSLSSADLSRDIRREIRKLIAQMEHMAASEVMDQVHRSLTLYLCASCYQDWIEDPTG
jgi:hypothetical protein